MRGGPTSLCRVPSFFWLDVGRIETGSQPSRWAWILGPEFFEGLGDDFTVVQLLGTEEIGHWPWWELGESNET